MVLIMSTFGQFRIHNDDLPTQNIQWHAQYKKVVASGLLHLLQVRARDWNGGCDEDMDRPPELPDGSFVDCDDIITMNAR